MDRKVKQHLDKVNRDLKDAHEGACDLAFEKIREAEKGYGKDAFIRAMQYLCWKRPMWNTELTDRLRHGGFSEFEHFDCDWCGDGGGKGLVSFRMWRGEDSDNYKMVAYEIPAVQKCRYGRTRYELRRPEFRPIVISDLTDKVVEDGFRESKHAADQFLKAATDLPNKILRTLHGYVNYSNSRIHDELDDVAKKYGVKE